MVYLMRWTSRGVADLIYGVTIGGVNCYSFCQDLSRLKLFTETGTGTSQNLR